MATGAEDNPAVRVRERIRAFLKRTGLTKQAFVTRCGYSTDWLTKVLGSKNDVRLRELDRVAKAMGSTAAELVRGSEEHYDYELSPTEVKVIERLRSRPDMQDAVVSLINALDRNRLSGYRHVK